MILTAKEIKDLAEFAGFYVAADDNILETEYVIEKCSPKGVSDDDGIIRHYKHIAYLEEYPDEGVYPLGDEYSR